MNTENWFGLRILRLDTEEALGQRWKNYKGPADLVRVRDPAASERAALRAAGFTPKPAWITWVAELDPRHGSYVERLAPGERWAVRAGQRAVRENGIKFAITHPLASADLDAFLEIYTDQVDHMRFGVPFAAQERDELLSSSGDYYQLTALAENVPVGGCLCRWDRARGCLTIRFTATRVDSRRLRMTRPMYIEAIRLATEVGADRVSLGTDPSLYGHLAQPGLFEFKSRFGFAAVPTGVWDSTAAEDEADLVLSGSQLTRPTLLVGYAPDRHAPTRFDTPLRLARWAQLTIVANGDDELAKRYDAEFATSIRRLAPYQRESDEQGVRS